MASGEHIVTCPGDFERTAFRYRPLKSSTHVRVLSLEPGKDQDPLHGRLRQIDLKPSLFEARARPGRMSNLRAKVQSVFSKKDQGYEALSYVWGDPQTDRFIHCPTGKIPIAANLSQALLHIRSSDRTRVLWVDAVCIDQNNVQERSHQVSIMGSIYSHARQVLVWLGPDPRNVGTSTFDALKTLVHPPFLTVPDEQVLPYMEQIEKSEWFTRLWVVQEFFMSKRAIAIWGHAEINFIYLQAPWSKWLVDAKFQGPRWCARRAWGFQTALRFTGALHCSDPLDRIYAILALSRNDPAHFREKIERIVPDYSKPPSQLFLEVACIFVESGRSQQALAHVNHKSIPSGIEKLLPSWVPNWGEWTEHEPLLVLDKGSGAMGSYLEGPTIDYERRILTTKGIVVDEVIDSTKSDLISSDLHSAICNIVTFWEDNLKSSAASSSVHTSSMEKDPQVNLLQALLYVRYIGSSLDTIETLAAELFAPLGSLEEVVLMLDEIPLATEMLQSLSNSVRDHCHITGEQCPEGNVGRNHWRYRKLFITKCSHIGLGPLSLRSGDALAAIEGLSSSVLVRRSDEHCVFVGTCYVPSIADGEATRGYRSKDNPMEVFELR
ncbi:heterokaryon incompatibility protein-domain-containing protein [Paraphoma chrysanthemicola]|uniref:Heterokaryon incompatibility protein-domain-containing protein n=1 Tax=Paraphoma chrysanthemicola TaxID=798071 RepID=A0A8K0R0Y7_9PLEO|nr:heterokaryon incompatibility protein-domain-containing protein [Paraphoma chrysanthemicola]